MHRGVYILTDQLSSESNCHLTGVKDSQFSSLGMLGTCFHFLIFTAIPNNILTILEGLVWTGRWPVRLLFLHWHSWAASDRGWTCPTLFKLKFKIIPTPPPETISPLQKEKEKRMPSERAHTQISKIDFCLSGRSPLYFPGLAFDHKEAIGSDGKCVAFLFGGLDSCLIKGCFASPGKKITFSRLN